MNVTPSYPTNCTFGHFVIFSRILYRCVLNVVYVVFSFEHSFASRRQEVSLPLHVLASCVTISTIYNKSDKKDMETKGNHIFFISIQQTYHMKTWTSKKQNISICLLERLLLYFRYYYIFQFLLFFCCIQVLYL